MDTPALCNFKVEFYTYTLKRRYFGTLKSVQAVEGISKFFNKSLIDVINGNIVNGHCLLMTYFSENVVFVLGPFDISLTNLIVFPFHCIVPSELEQLGDDNWTTLRID